MAVKRKVKAKKKKSLGRLNVYLLKGYSGWTVCRNMTELSRRADIGETVYKVRLVEIGKFEPEIK